MAPSDWYYAKGNRQLGPVSSTELKQLSESGRLVPDDLVWREGMVEWIAAGKVKGLFDEPVEEPPGMESPPVQFSPAAAPAGFATSPTEPRFEGPRKHLFDMLIDLVRGQFPARFVDSSSTVFSLGGYYGLYVGMVMLLVFALVLGATAGSLPLVLAVSAAGVLALVVLQYASGKFLASLDTLNRSTSGRISSTALPDCFALLSMCGGLALLVALVIVALSLGSLSIMLWAIGGFILCEYLAILSLTLDALNLKVETDASAGEEAIGILSFLAKLILRLVPVGFGTGVTLGICDLIIASVSVASGHDTIVAGGPVMAALTGGMVLFISAALPIVAYILFILAYFVVDVLHSILILPRLLEKDEREADQT
jgi:hypothetical protein